MGIGSESAKIKSRKLSRMSFHENFSPRNFLAIYGSLVPRPHPLMRKNTLMSQVKFLGLMWIFVAKDTQVKMQILL